MDMAKGSRRRTGSQQSQSIQHWWFIEAGAMQSDGDEEWQKHHDQAMGPDSWTYWRTEGRVGVGVVCRYLYSIM